MDKENLVYLSIVIIVPIFIYLVLCNTQFRDNKSDET